MKLKVKDVDIATGGIVIALLNKKDAAMLDLHYEDRIRVTKGKRSAIAIVDIAESEKAVPVGMIGCFEELLKLLHAKGGSNIKIFLENKPESIAYIKKKLDGKKLSDKEVHCIIKDIVSRKLSEVELTYFIAASYARGLSKRETVALTKAMIDTGDVLNFKCRPIIDKHCIGGVAGNRTTMIVIPILAAAGITVPKTSSRSITSPAGTADTMEVLADVSLSLSRIKKVVNKTNGCLVWGGAVNLAPADDKIIHVENPLSIDSEGNMLASILAKKGSVSATHILIDIPIGKGAKVASVKDAKKLEQDFETIGKGLGMKIKTVITDGSQPIGRGIGPALEARDVLWILKNDGRAPHDLRRKALMLAEEMLAMVRKPKDLASKILESGKAYEKMVEIIESQGKKIVNPDKIRLGRYMQDVISNRTGRISHIDNKIISHIARLAGAPNDKGAGIYLYHHKCGRVKKGDRLYTIYSENRTKLNFALEAASKKKGIILK